MQQTRASNQALIDFFAKPAMQEHSIGIHQTYGLTLSMATAPVIVPPQEWIPIIFKDESAFEAINEQMFSELITLVIALWQTLKQDLQQKKFQFPEKCVIEKDQPSKELVDFCTGYLMGYYLLEKTWIEVYQLKQMSDEDMEETKPLSIYMIKLILPNEIPDDPEMQAIFNQITINGIYQALPNILMILEKYNEIAFQKSLEQFSEQGEIG